MGVKTGFIDGSTGNDVGDPLVEKSYLIDRYPELADTFKQAGLWGMGEGGFGQLGNNNTTNRSSPVQTVAGGTNWKQVACGGTYIASIKTDGTLWNWGYNFYGQLGTNNTTATSSPVQTVAAGNNWKQVSCGTYTTFAIKTDGTLWTWGDNEYGQLGVNDRTHRSSPVQTIAGGTNWKQVSNTGSLTAAIKTDGTLWLWGNNGGGQLGTNNLTSYSSPVQTISGGTNWKQVSVGVVSAAIKTDGTLWLWGVNNNGQLGTNNLSWTSSPVQTISAGTNWKQVSVSPTTSFCLAIKTDGTLWGWGANDGGQLGTNELTNKSSPVQTIAGGTNWKQVSAGTCAIKTDGTLWSWGFNPYGQLGTNDITNRSSPVQTVSGGTNWKQVSIANFNSFAIRDDSSDPL